MDLIDIIVRKLPDLGTMALVCLDHHGKCTTNQQLSSTTIPVFSCGCTLSEAFCYSSVLIMPFGFVKFTFPERDRPLVYMYSFRLPRLAQLRNRLDFIGFKDDIASLKRYDCGQNHKRTELASFIHSLPEACKQVFVDTNPVIVIANGHSDGEGSLL
jgi:hypothetical protein